MNLDKHQIKRQFDRAAASYDSVAGMQRSIVDELLSNLPHQAENVVDLGCGTGYALSCLHSLLPNTRLQGIDLAPSMISRASQVVPEARFKTGDIESLPYSDSSFDLCLSSSAIQWCDNSQAFNELARISKPGATILVSSFLYGTLQSWRELWGGDNQQAFLSKAQFHGAIVNAGFEDIRVWERTHVQSFCSFDDAVLSIRQLGAGNATPSRSKGLMTRAQLASVRAKADAIINSKGALQLEYRVVYASASKPESILGLAHA